MQNLALALLPKVDEELKPEIIHWATFYEHRIRLGSKVIFHLEAFVAKGTALIDWINRSNEGHRRILDGIVLSFKQTIAVKIFIPSIIYFGLACMTKCIYFQPGGYGRNLNTVW
jgi:hypothetical protein